MPSTMIVKVPVSKFWNVTSTPAAELHGTIRGAMRVSGKVTRTLSTSAATQLRLLAFRAAHHQGSHRCRRQNPFETPHVWNLAELRSYQQVSRGQEEVARHSDEARNERHRHRTNRPWSNDSGSRSSGVDARRRP